ncbi:hypothetical protein Pfo_011769 [Paulownia fortunei]|nr:hypothetical protein Pfo_011769 [Paulownia fortunei]
MMMTPNKLNYSPIEKIYLALIFTIQKLNHYFQAHTVRLIWKANPLKYVMTRPVLSNRLARWYLQLQQFEIIYVPQKAMKEQVLADFLAGHPISAEWELSDDLPDEDVLVIEITPHWKIYFDGASHKKGAGAGVIFIISDGEVLPYSFTLIQNCSNNIAEYQALILRLEMAVDIKQLHLKVYGDSKLVVNQLLGLYEVKKPELLPYFNYARRLIRWLRDIVIEHIPRTDNNQADALANLVSILAMPEAFNKTLCTLLKKVIAKSSEIGTKESKKLYGRTEPLLERLLKQLLMHWCMVLKLYRSRRTNQRKNTRLRLEELEALDEKRLKAQQRLECYQARLSRAFDKKVRSHSFQVGDLVLAVRRPIITIHRTGNKFTSKWDGPYVVKEVYTNGAYKLVAEDGLRIGPINGKFLKRYYA